MGQKVKAKSAVLLVNLGTPDACEVKPVRRYLREFLMDGRVIDIPAWQRVLLVNGIIAPFRAPESTKGYQALWTDDGSPLKVYAYKVKSLLQSALGSSYVVDVAMRYQNPSITEVLANLKPHCFAELIVIPLYPQYASASTGSSIEAVLDEIKKWQTMPSLKIVSQFCHHPLLIQTFCERAKEHLDHKTYDHIIFSYHGLPERQILKGSTQGYCRLGDCCSVYHERNRYCYRAQCFETSRHLADQLHLKASDYTVSFQSRLGRDPWIKPYTDEMIKSLVQSGKKRILCFSPAFVADCLETTIEIGQEYRDLFMECGGEVWDWVESCNDHPTWIACLKDMVLQQSNQPVASVLAS